MVQKRAKKKTGRKKAPVSKPKPVEPKIAPVESKVSPEESLSKVPAKKSVQLMRTKAEVWLRLFRKRPLEKATLAEMIRCGFRSSLRDLAIAAVHGPREVGDPFPTEDKVETAIGSVREVLREWMTHTKKDLPFTCRVRVQKAGEEDEGEEIVRLYLAKN